MGPGMQIDMAAIDDKIDELRGTIGQVRESQIRTEQVMAAFTEKLHEHSDTLYGNGHAGLKEVSNDHAHAIAAITDRVNRALIVLPWYARIAEKVCTSLITAILYLVAGAILWAIVVREVASAAKP